MKTNQMSKLKMYLTLRVFLTTNAEFLAKLPHSAEFIAALDAAILQIQTNSEEHLQSSKGVTENKNILHDELVVIAADNSRKIQAYANYKSDKVLLSKIKFTQTALDRLPGLELVNVSNSLYHSIEAILQEVTPYHLTVDTQLIFRTAIDDFAASIPQPRESQLKAKGNTSLELHGFEKADAAIEQIDGVVDIVRLTEPVFFAGYTNARKIVLQGTGSLQVKGTVTEAATGKPIPNAILTFRLSGQKDVTVEKETAAKGGFQIKSLEEGIYDVTVTKMGFKTQTVTVTVRWDELCVLDVKMEGI